MNIEFLRDLVIVIFGAVAAGVLVMLAVLSISMYRQVRLMQKSMAKTLQLIESFASMGMEVQKTFDQASNVIPRIRDRVWSFVRAFQGGKEDGSE